MEPWSPALLLSVYCGADAGSSNGGIMAASISGGTMAQSCDACQTAVGDEAKFCTECGHKLGAAHEPPIERLLRTPDRPRPRIFGAVLGALIVWTLLLIILALCLYVLMSPPTPAGM